MIDRECFTHARYSCIEPSHSVGKESVGELSLSSQEECLSLQEPILTDQLKVAKRIGQRYPCAQATRKVGPLTPMWYSQGHPEPNWVIYVAR